MSEELNKDETTIRRATNLLHERGLIHKTVGGGWDRGKVRHRECEYEPSKLRSLSGGEYDFAISRDCHPSREWHLERATSEPPVPTSRIKVSFWA